MSFKRWQKIALLLMAADMICIVSSFFLALILRFDGDLRGVDPQHYYPFFQSSIIIYALVSIVVYASFKLYNCIWRHVAYNEFAKCISSVLLSMLFYVLWMGILGHRMPISYYVFGGGLQITFLLASRFSFRILRMLYFRIFHNNLLKQQNALLIGGGLAGQMVLRDLMLNKHSSIRFCCIIDDDPNKWGRSMEGIQIIGGREKIEFAVQKYHIKKIYVAIPSATMEERVSILHICKDLGCETQILPGLYQLANGEVSISQMREVSIEDLLAREPIQVDTTEILNSLKDKVILVTGGGGSIGSELCRQIAGHSPKRLIIFDIYENNAYEIEQELRRKYPELDLVVLIGSVRDTKRINAVFETYRPEFVYHAAAHKHVPLMENSPCESIKNNVLGTYKTARAAMIYGCRRFLLVSTDKAVNPTNIMGASKRLCEMVIQTMNQISQSGNWSALPSLQTHLGADKEMALPSAPPSEDFPKTEFVGVRFGNVLGSNGSVIPLFKQQIKEGGPITVTHPDIIRYFMTIPEAVSLVLQSSVYAKGGEIFVLDMGEPVKIVDLALNLIKLSGFKPDVDIKIKFTGLRPGEKLYEERLYAEEGLQSTANKRISIAHPMDFNPNVFFSELSTLAEAAYTNNPDIFAIVKAMVPTYHPEKKQA